MSDIDTAALRALHSKAEAGRLGKWGFKRRRPSDRAVLKCDGGGGFDLGSCFFDSHAALIAAAVNALVPLCDEVERLRERPVVYEAAERAMAEAVDAMMVRAHDAERRAVLAEVKLASAAPGATESSVVEALVTRLAEAESAARSATSSLRYTEQVMAAMGEVTAALLPFITACASDPRVKNYMEGAFSFGERRFTLLAQVDGGLTPAQKNMELTVENDALRAEVERRRGVR